VTYEHVESGHTKRVTVTRGAVGWELREEHDSQVVRMSRFTDWHRVERAIGVYVAAGLQPGGSAGRHSTNR
jgi:hypothetical protein